MNNYTFDRDKWKPEEGIDYDFGVSKHVKRTKRREERRSAGSCLITAHNSTLSHAIFWLDGSKAKISRNNNPVAAVGGGKRGMIVDFSKGSRRRLMRRMAEVNRDVLPLFVTLTFPDEFHDYIYQPAVWKQVLKRFINRFRRGFPGGGFFWRLEMKPRKSGLYIGEMFPHFHLLVYGVGEVELYMWIFRAWWESCGKLSSIHLSTGVDVQIINNSRHLFSYVSKYMAKVADSNLNIGRVWGVVQVENIPWVKGVLTVLTEREAVQMIRYLRRFAHLKGRDYKSLTVLLDANQWFYNLDKLLYPF